MRLLKKLLVRTTTIVLALLGITYVISPGAKTAKGDAEQAKDTAEEEHDDAAKKATPEAGPDGPDTQHPTSGDPVDVVTGAMVVNAIDFELPGPIPLVWRRNWSSDSRRMGHLGYGFSNNFEMGLDSYENRKTTILLADGRSVNFPFMLPGLEYFNYREKLLLRREEDHYCIFDPKTRYSYLLYPSEKGYTQYKLAVIYNAAGHKISVEYNDKGCLSKITDSVGRELSVMTNGAGRVTQVSLDDNVLTRYMYNNEQDLIEAIDAAGQSTHMSYEGHLMVKRTDRNKNSFYWKYEKGRFRSRVMETWGDNKVLYRKFQYHDGERYNVVTDSLGNAIEYHYDERKICTKTIYADKTEIQKEYNVLFELMRETDEEGRQFSYKYNDRSQVISVERPDGGIVAFEYDETGRLISTTNPEGGIRKWIYNDDDTINASIDENGTETLYSYNGKKLVESVTNALGDTIHLDYDSHGNLSQINLPDGSTSSWEYDSRGNCIGAVNPLGAVQKYQYDTLNRIVKANLAGGNEIELQYDAYDDIVHAKDKQTEVSFEYTILGSLRSRTQNGRKIKYKYDTEENLVSVTNEKNEVYQFERDIKGNISKEVGYDGVTRAYERDYSGLLREIKRPGDRFTRYARDQLGNIVRADYYDGAWDTFEYNKNSELVGAANQFAKLKFERNPAGQIVREWQDGHWIASEYDKLGIRTQISSSLGAKIDTQRNQMGRASSVIASQAGNPEWIAQMQYNGLGQEIQRMLPGDVISSYQYDATGRPTKHGVQSHQRDTRQHKYDWDINDQLKKVTDELTGTYITYGYDEFRNLAWSRDNRFSFIYRSVDEVGNLYETENKSDRVYGAGSRLEQLRSKTVEANKGERGKPAIKWTKFTHDSEGNLSRKIEANGDIWQYEYYGNGMMSKVVKPDRTEVAFKYDSLGRRIEKKTSEKATRFVWDGNNPLHEYEDEELVTWVFNDGFVPTAKLTNDGAFSIISDYLGTPVEAYDKTGECIWSAELDIYGRVKEFTGDVDFVPFRYQGQYGDVETGLYYSRFRYYDPLVGQYTQQDPIGLAGGNPTLYGYVHDPNTWIDPFGLGECGMGNGGTGNGGTGNGGAGSRTFTSTDKYVGETANAIEARSPGNVVGVNRVVTDSTGRIITDYDIELNNYVIQVKSGTAKGLTTQMQNTAASTGKTVIGYTPDLNSSSAVVKGVQNAGFNIFTNLDDLLNFIGK